MIATRARMAAGGSASSGGDSDPLPYTTGLVLRLDASQITGLSDGATVAQWDDVSGNNRHATQATALQRPTYKIGILNGHAVVRFAGGASAHRMDLGNLSAAFTSGATVFVVATISTDAAYNLYSTQFADNLSTDSIWRWDTGVGFLGDFRTARINNYPATMPTTGSHIFCLQSGASYELLVDNVSKGAQTGSFAAGTVHGVSLGHSGATNTHLTGDIAEVIVFDHVLSGANRGLVTSHLATKYGITI